jgi:hypothetical protein
MAPSARREPDLCVREEEVDEDAGEVGRHPSVCRWCKTGMTLVSLHHTVR